VTVDSILALPQKALAVTGALSFQQFLQRMPALAPALRRRLSEIRLPVAAQTALINYPDHLNCVALVSEDSPETLVVVPILVHIAAASPRLLLTFLCDTDDLSGLAALLEEFDLVGELGELDLPQLFIFDEEWNFQAQWGPHPKAADPYLDEWFERHPEYAALELEETQTAQVEYARLFDQLTQEMRVWYNSGLNHACVDEICALLTNLLEESAGDEGDDEDEEVR
jgi:hypothetical protein